MHDDRPIVRSRLTDRSVWCQLEKQEARARPRPPGRRQPPPQPSTSAVEEFPETGRGVQAEAFEWLGARKQAEFDLVILDPPSLARRETERAGAIRAYERLAAGALGVLRPGGTLVASSCSAHVTAEEFFGAVRRAAGAIAGGFKELETTGQPADHPAGFPEARYLKCVYLRLGGGRR